MQSTAGDALYGGAHDVGRGATEYRIELFRCQRLRLGQSLPDQVTAAEKYLPLVVGEFVLLLLSLGIEPPGDLKGNDRDVGILSHQTIPN